MFFSTFAIAEGSAGTSVHGADMAGPGGLSQFFLIGAFIFIFYMFFIRPQSKKAKEHQQLISALQKGDEVITNGGLLGKITRITDSFFILAIAEGVEIPVQRNAVLTSVPKGTLKSIA